MKKRILIVSHALELGGAERSLVGLMNALDPDRAEVDLFLLRHEGEMMNMIPPQIKLLPEIPAYTVLARPMKTTLKEGYILLTAARLFGKAKAVRFEKKHGYTESGVVKCYAAFGYYYGESTYEYEKLPTFTVYGYTGTAAETYADDNGFAFIDLDTVDSDHCSCACHKKGIVNFFFKILLFFQKIFRKNMVCKCGVYHY